MSQSSADRNLLLGVLAVQMEFVTCDQLIDAMNVWTQNRTVGIDTIFRKQLLIDEHTQRKLGDLADEHCLGEKTTKVGPMVDAFATVAPVSMKPFEIMDSIEMDTVAPSPPIPTLPFELLPNVVSSQELVRRRFRYELQGFCCLSSSVRSRCVH